MEVEFQARSQMPARREKKNNYHEDQMAREDKIQLPGKRAARQEKIIVSRCGCQAGVPGAKTARKDNQPLDPPLPLPRLVEIFFHPTSLP